MARIDLSLVSSSSGVFPSRSRWRAAGQRDGRIEVPRSGLLGGVVLPIHMTSSAAVLDEVTHRFCRRPCFLTDCRIMGDSVLWKAASSQQRTFRTAAYCFRRRRDILDSDGKQTRLSLGPVFSNAGPFLFQKPSEISADCVDVHACS